MAMGMSSITTVQLESRYGRGHRGILAATGRAEIRKANADDADSDDFFSDSDQEGGGMGLNGMGLGGGTFDSISAALGAGASAGSKNEMKNSSKNPLSTRHEQAKYSERNSAPLLKGEGERPPSSLVAERHPSRKTKAGTITRRGSAIWIGMRSYRNASHQGCPHCCV